MSIIRTCLTCNWQFPGIYTKRVCRFCDGPIDTFQCKDCKDWVPHTKMNTSKTYCIQCENARYRKWARANPDKVQAIKARLFYKQNKAEVDALDKMLEHKEVAYKTLTEPEWAEVCRYFDGCAICGDEYIEARTFFLSYKQGGKYQAWNVIPTCGTCGVAARDHRYKNPFRWLKSEQAKQLGMTPARAATIMNFLTHQVEKVME